MSLRYKSTLEKVCSHRNIPDHCMPPCSTPTAGSKGDVRWTCIQDLRLCFRQFAAYLSREVRAIVDVVVGQGEGVETSCRCPGRLVVYGGGRSVRKVLRLIQPAKVIPSANTLTRIPEVHREITCCRARGRRGWELAQAIPAGLACVRRFALRRMVRRVRKDQARD